MRGVAAGSILLLSAALAMPARAEGRWTFAPAVSGSGGRLAFVPGAGDPHERLRLECAQPGGPVTLHAAISPLTSGKPVRLRFKSAGRVATVRGTVHRGPSGTSTMAGLPAGNRLLALLHGTGTLLVHSEPRGFSDQYDLETVPEPLRQFDASCGSAAGTR